MPASTLSVSDEAGLDDVLRRSEAERVILFVHDPFCGISRRAHEEVVRAGADAVIVDVARHPAMAGLIAGRTGVRHASPQVLVLHNGSVAADASHSGISATWIRLALTNDPSASHAETQHS